MVRPSERLAASGVCASTRVGDRKVQRSWLGVRCPQRPARPNGLWGGVWLGWEGGAVPQRCAAGKIGEEGFAGGMVRHGGGSWVLGGVPGTQMPYAR